MALDLPEDLNPGEKTRGKGHQTANNTIENGNSNNSTKNSGVCGGGGDTIQWQ